MIAPVLAWAGILAALIYLPMSEDAPNGPRSVVKMLPLLFFAYAAYHAGGGAFLIAGLLLSALGDFALSRSGQTAFLSGLGAFALAHLAYVVHFLALSGVPLWAAFTLNAPLAVFLAAFAGLAELWLVPYTAGLKWPVRVYIVLITLMGLAALTLPALPSWGPRSSSPPTRFWPTSFSVWTPTIRSWVGSGGRSGSSTSPGRR